MKKPFGHVGGKKLLVDKLEKLLPKDYGNYIYVEPFAGGATLYYYKTPSNKYEVLNDIDNNIYTLLKGLKIYSADKINNSLQKLPRTKETFKKIINNKGADAYSKFIRLLYLKKNSFFGQMTHFSIRDKDKIIHSDIMNYHDRMKNTKVYNKSYESIIKQFDSPNTLFYLDPPYEKSEGLYENPDIDYIKLANILKNIKGKVLLSINYNKEFIKLFNFMKYKVLSTKYSEPLIGSQTREVKELVFFNY